MKYKSLITWNTVKSATGNLLKFAGGVPSSKFHLKMKFNCYN